MKVSELPALRLILWCCLRFKLLHLVRITKEQVFSYFFLPTSYFVLSLRHEKKETRFTTGYS
jgi:hypothetical protein